MISTLVTVFSALLLALLAKRKSPKTRRRFSLRRVRVTPSVALGALVSGIVVKGGISGAAPNTYRAISSDQVWSLEGLTSGEGPVVVGYAHSDYTVTEIKEAIDAAASIDPGLKIERERAGRLVRIVGIITSDVDRLNDGKPLKTRLNWLITPGDEVNIFAMNESGATLSTGAVLHITGNLWVKDSA